MPNYFDQVSHPFHCKNPQCGARFEIVLRSLICVNEIICPKCGAVEDIRESKRAGQIGKDFDMATELDNKLNEKK
jgi:hypothetical protein